MYVVIVIVLELLLNFKVVWFCDFWIYCIILIVISWYMNVENKVKKKVKENLS